MQQVRPRLLVVTSPRTGRSHSLLFVARVCVCCSMLPMCCREQDESTCVQCEPGSFSAAAGASACTLCDVNTYTDQPGTTQACTPCPPGKVAPARGAAACVFTPCGCRYYRSESSGDCALCAANSYCPCDDVGVLSGGTVVPCQALKTSAAGSTRPEQCVCADGTFWQVSTGKCVACPGGKTGTGGECWCKPGYWITELQPATAQCQPCARGFVCAGRAEPPVACGGRSLLPRLPLCICSVLLLCNHG
jgi:hypothetical protein